MQAYKVFIRANGCDSTTYTRFLPPAMEKLFDAGQEDYPSRSTLRRHLKRVGHYAKYYPSGALRWMIEAFR